MYYVTKIFQFIIINFVAYNTKYILVFFFIEKHFNKYIRFLSNAIIKQYKTMKKSKCFFIFVMVNITITRFIKNK